MCGSEELLGPRCVAKVAWVGGPWRLRYGWCMMGLFVWMGGLVTNFEGVTGAWFRDLLICTFARAGQLGAGLWLLHLIYKGMAHSWCCWEATTF